MAMKITAPSGQVGERAIRAALVCFLSLPPAITRRIDAFDSRSVADRTTGRYAVGQVVKEGLDTAKADEKAKAASAAAAAAAAATTAAAPSGAAPSAAAAGPAAAPSPHERPSAPVAAGEKDHS